MAQLETDNDYSWQIITKALSLLCFRKTRI